MSDSLDPDQALHSVGPDLGPNCLQRVISRRKKSQLVRKELITLQLNDRVHPEQIAYKKSSLIGVYSVLYIQGKQSISYILTHTEERSDSVVPC